MSRQWEFVKLLLSFFIRGRGRNVPILEHGHMAVQKLYIDNHVETYIITPAI